MVGDEDELEKDADEYEEADVEDDDEGDVDEDEAGGGPGSIFLQTEV